MIHRIDSVNPDIDDRVIKPNQARNALNLRFSMSADDNNLSGGILVYGNDKILFTPPSVGTLSGAGLNKVVGTAKDYENNVVYFALYNRAVNEPTGIDPEPDLSYNHGIYRIKNGIVENIVQGGWLRFTEDCNVSIASIGDLLYWTDNINQPKMVNIEKALGNLKDEDGNVIAYPNKYMEWMYTQIKRPGALPPSVLKRKPNEQAIVAVNQLLLNSIDYTNNFNDVVNPQGYQFSYYYIYDNYEESRLAPISDICFWNDNLFITLPQEEFIGYVKNNNVIRSVVFVYRTGNDGVWYVLKKIDNKFSNYSAGLVFTNFFGNTENYTGLNKMIYHVVNNMKFIQGVPVSADITDSYFDAVPLKSKCNTIAINKIFHSNYVIDYPQVKDINLEITVKRNQKEIVMYDAQGQTSIFLQNIDGTPGAKAFMFGRYKAGLELLDEYGRRIGVVAVKEFKIPRPTYKRRLLSYNSQYGQQLSKTLNPRNDAEYNYVAIFKLTGPLPDWVKSYRIVMTKNLDYNFYFKTQVKLFYWYTAYTNDNAAGVQADFVSTLPIFYENTGYAGWNPLSEIASEDGKQKYYLRGFAFKLSSNDPYIFNPDEDNYITLAEEYKYTLEQVDPLVDNNTPNIQLIEYKISKFSNNFYWVDYTQNAKGDIKTVLNEENIPIQAPVLIPVYLNIEPPKNSYNAEGQPFVLSRQSFHYQAYIYSKKKTTEDIFYQNQNVFTIENYQQTLSQTGFLQGDSYFANYKKVFAGVNIGEAKFYFIGEIFFNYSNNNAGTICYNRPDNGNSYETVSALIEGMAYSMNPCDIFNFNWSSDVGQPSIVNETQKQTISETSVLPSGDIILGSEINNLNRFNSVDAEDMPADNGPITSTVITNTGQTQPGVMLAIGEFGIQSIYLNAIQQTASDGTGTVTLSKNVLGSTRPLIGQYGTKHPASVTVTPDGLVYWYSDVVYDIIRYSQAGMERLGKTYSFANFLRNKYSAVQSFISYYDEMTDEIILIPKNRNAIVFNERYKTFQGEREIKTGVNKTPERVIGLANQQYMFLDGEIYVSKVGSPLNTFFGSQKIPSISIVTNELPSVMKQWNQIKVFGPVPATTAIRTEGTVNQETFIPLKWYVQRKDDYEAAIKRDLNTGGVLTGRPMESRILYTTFEFNILGFNKLNFIEIKSNKSVVQ